MKTTVNRKSRYILQLFPLHSKMFKNSVFVHKGEDINKFGIQQHELDDSDVQTKEARKEANDEDVSDLRATELNRGTTVPSSLESEYLDLVRSRSNRLQFCRREGQDKLGTNKLFAFLIGIVHGLAGPGGVLAVRPAIQLQNIKLAYLYLFIFCITSIIVMSVFAALYGILSDRLSAWSKIQLRMSWFSACLSLIVGVLWLALVAPGILEIGIA